MRYGIDLQIVGPKVPTPVIPPKNAVISVQIIQIFIELERYVIYAKKKSTYSFKNILEDL